MNCPEQIAFEFPQGNDLLRRLQTIEFEMAVVIRDIFEKHGIRYVIEYGSLLGAVRHGGFIPWDDDFDYVVFEDDYEKASDVLRNELPEKYVLHDRNSDPNYFYSFAKVRHLHSVAIEEGFTDNLKYQGISIDLFKGRVENNNRFARPLFLARSHVRSHWSKFKSIQNPAEFVKALGEGIFVLYYSFLHFITPKSLFFHKSPDSDQYFIPIERYLPLSKVTFNGELFNAPCDPDYVLTDRYGDWRAYPKTITFHMKHVEIFSDK